MKHINIVNLWGDDFLTTRHQRTRRNRGFSLVELIIVVAIMAILAGALAPMFIQYIERSRRSTDLQTADAIQSALQRVLAETDFNPNSGNNVIIIGSNTTYNNPATDIKDELLIELGGVPSIKSFPDYYWYIVYNSSYGSVPEVHLTDSANGTPIYELFPDNTSFAENKQPGN